MRRDFTPTSLERLAGVDPFRALFRDGLTIPVKRAIRCQFVIEMVAYLQTVLTDPKVSEAAAYETFHRVLELLNVYLREEAKR